MYESFFDLTQRPFSTVPDPAVLYWSEAHTLTYTMLRYGLMTRAPITVVTGEIGAGKTTMVRHLLDEMPFDIEVGLISNMQAGKGALLHWVLMSLDQPIDPAETYVQQFRRFQEHVIQSYAAGRRVALIFDEAQNLDVSALEELRMLSNINADGNELLQLVLVGQPQLRSILARPELTQFSQRIAADFHLSELSAHEVQDYIDQRLKVAGARWRIFPDATCRLIHRATRGIPRLINILCELALVYGFAADRKVIDEPLLIEFLVSARRRGIYTQFSDVVDRPEFVARTV